MNERNIPCVILGVPRSSHKELAFLPSSGLYTVNELATLMEKLPSLHVLPLYHG
jgi:hypothetical protein